MLQYFEKLPDCKKYQWIDRSERSGDLLVPHRCNFQSVSECLFGCLHGTKLWCTINLKGLFSNLKYFCCVFTPKNSLSSYFGIRGSADTCERNAKLIFIKENQWMAMEVVVGDVQWGYDWTYNTELHVCQCQTILWKVNSNEPLQTSLIMIRRLEWRFRLAFSSV